MSRYRAPALDKGLDILELLAAHDDGLTQAHIAKALGRSPSELYRMLDTLVRRGYVRRSAQDERLTLGLKLFSLATRHSPMRRLLSLASEVTSTVAMASLQSCHLSLYRDGNLFVAARAESPDRLTVSLRVGAPLSLLNTGSGLTMLSFQRKERRAQMLAAHGVSALSSEVSTILASTLTTGYLRRASGQAIGVTDLAYPVIGRTGDAVAVLSMPYFERVDPSEAPDQSECIRLLAEGAAKLAADLPHNVVDADDLQRIDDA